MLGRDRQRRTRTVKYVVGSDIGHGRHESHQRKPIPSEETTDRTVLIKTYTGDTRR